jgi:hypothetical protein
VTFFALVNMEKQKGLVTPAPTAVSCLAGHRNIKAGGCLKCPKDPGAVMYGARAEWEWSQQLSLKKLE